MNILFKMKPGDTERTHSDPALEYTISLVDNKIERKDGAYTEVIHVAAEVQTEPLDPNNEGARPDGWDPETDMAFTLDLTVRGKTFKGTTTRTFDLSGGDVKDFYVQPHISSSGDCCLGNNGWLIPHLVESGTNPMDIMQALVDIYRNVARGHEFPGRYGRIAGKPGCIDDDEEGEYTCDNCGESCDDIYHASDSGNDLCYDCYSKCISCERCGDMIFYTDDMTYIDDVGASWCDSCTTEHAYRYPDDCVYSYPEDEEDDE